MKNVIFIAQDRNDISNIERKRIIQSMTANGDFQIVLLIINPAENKEEYLAFKGVKKVITSLELEYIESMKGLSYEAIAKYREFQSDIVTMAYRMFGDIQLSKYYYYEGLAFWIRFFDENQVDVIIHTKPYHGFMYDCCDIIARKRGINSFHMTPIGYHNTFTIYKYYQIQPVFSNGVENVEYLLQSSYDKTGLAPSGENKSWFRRILYSLGGNLLEDFITRFVRWDWTPRAYERKRAKIYWSEKFWGYMRLKKSKRYLESISDLPDYGEKYVCYFLHFEPEASIQVSTELANQLVIIKMLSETLPKGWVLYVKEHPAQFDVNNDVGYYFMYDAQLFKNIKFYKKIKSFSNVRLIRGGVKSDDLINHSQAVASILGTVFFESVLKKKPVLVFSDITPVAYIKDAFSIHSYSECEVAMQQIKAGFVPDYDDSNDVIGKYVFKGEYMTENIMELLHNECFGRETVNDGG